MNPLQELPGLTKVRGGAFYLHGDDEFRKEEVVRALVEAHLDPATADFNFDPLRGTDVDTETLASVLGTPPMMAEWRVVVIREVEGLAISPRSREVLLEAVGKPPPGLALILSCSVPQGSKAKFYKDLAKTARSVEFQPLSPADVPGWLMARARSHFDVELDVEAAQALGAAIGANLGILNMELEKLVDVAGEGRSITMKEVEAAGTRLPSQDRWRWFDLVGEGQLDEALESLGVLLGQGENGVGLVIGLTTHFLRLGVVAEDGPGALEAALPPHQRWLARRLVAQAKRWRPVEIDAALEGLLRVDRLLKASSLSDEHLLEEWLLGLLARKVAA
ncbi:MAG TPA: DNA polymerase III subunit delta [Longimicrobiales bacterium]|nr:DNA polymerase III subunit delta [Longimicrobiales bacterium]